MLQTYVRKTGTQEIAAVSSNQHFNTWW
jgi:hypothetical protein